MKKKLNKRGRPVFERTVFGRIRKAVDFGDGVLVPCIFEMKMDGLHVRKRGARKGVQLSLAMLANHAQKQPKLL
jgi:hypothetical protein